MGRKHTPFTPFRVENAGLPHSKSKTSSTVNVTPGVAPSMTNVTMTSQLLMATGPGAI